MAGFLRRVVLTPAAWPRQPAAHIGKIRPRDPEVFPTVRARSGCGRARAAGTRRWVGRPGHRGDQSGGGHQLDSCRSRAARGSCSMRSGRRTNWHWLSASP